MGNINWSSIGESSISSLGSSLAGGLSNALFGGIAAKRAEQAAQKQYQRQLDFWNKQNEYNTPLAQRQRMEDANLNPALMYGSGSSGGGTAGALSPVPGNEFEKSGGYASRSISPVNTDPVDTAIRLAQLDNIRADIDLKKGKTMSPGYADKLAENTLALGQSQILTQDSIQAVNNYKSELGRLTMLTDVAQAEQSLENSRVTFEKIVEDTIRVRNENSLFPAKAQMLNEQINMLIIEQSVATWRVEQIKHGIILTDAEVQKAYAMLELIGEQTSTQKTQQTLNEANTKLANTRADKVEQDVNIDKPAEKHAGLSYTSDRVEQYVKILKTFSSVFRP